MVANKPLNKPLFLWWMVVFDGAKTMNFSKTWRDGGNMRELFLHSGLFILENGANTFRFKKKQITTCTPEILNINTTAPLFAIFFSIHEPFNHA